MGKCKLIWLNVNIIYWSEIKYIVFALGKYKTEYRLRPPYWVFPGGLSTGDNKCV